MTDETGSPGGEAIAVIAPADTGTDLSISQAAAALTVARKPKEPTAESAPEATAEPELSVEDNAAPQTEATGETQEADPAEVPPLDLPRSWTKDRAEHWNALPRETQEYLTAQASKDSAEVRRSQNEAAEERKAAQADRELAKQERQAIAAELQRARQVLEREQLEQFPDIRSPADVRLLAKTDPLRYLDFKSHNDDLQWATMADQQMQQQKANETRSELESFQKKQDEIFAEDHPEMLDSKKANEIRDGVIENLVKNRGIPIEELRKFASNPEVAKFIYDHRIQKIFFDDWKFSQVKSAPLKAIPKPVPPVQRPGVSKPQGSAVSEREQVLTRQLNETGSLKVAQELRALQGKRRAS